ncbi:metal-sulfur cluster assembly factor [Priestia taiwanensis]|uniref:DNA methyltransferase n=1 Tax=Priestia taiwanensis TaxID=1347902 RepID=A0A917AR43_9BACI|nr:metal-sulfur cluster assembly factor [Priestia taiwanensis]MBM7363156.1 metal-sulfur cluster biosynthetic enzyme [Priestia taiwanensis]GGE68154.1 DNA methyltransferase [Priestia taiwanensis]
MVETITKEQILEELECVIDPELGVDIVNLGLIYDVIFVKVHHVKVIMTMTSMGCPMAGHIIADVKETLLLHVPVLKEVDVDIVWTPAWTKGHMSRLAKMALGLHA